MAVGVGPIPPAPTAKADGKVWIMAKRKSPPTRVDGAYPTPPRLGPLVPVRQLPDGTLIVQADRRFCRELAEFEAFQQHSWRYPSIPWLAASPFAVENHIDNTQADFDFEKWLDDLGPWLTSRLDIALSAGLLTTADVVGNARDCWEWIAVERRRKRPRHALIYRFALQLGRSLEEVFARSLDELVSTGRRNRQAAALAREAKKELQAERDSQRREAADAAWVQATKNFPTAAYDGDDGPIAREAARLLKKSVATLYRWRNKKLS